MKIFRNLGLAALMFLSACTKNYYGTGPSDPSDPNDVVVVRITNDSINLVVGEVLIPHADVSIPGGTNMSKEVVWVTQGSAVSFDAAKKEVKGIAAGTARVIATSVAYPGRSDTLFVTVYKNLTITLTPSASTLFVMKKGEVKDVTFSLSEGLPGAAAKSANCYSLEPQIMTVVTIAPGTCRMTGVFARPTSPTQLVVKTVAVDPVKGNVEVGMKVRVDP